MSKALAACDIGGSSLFFSSGYLGQVAAIEAALWQTVYRQHWLPHPLGRLATAYRGHWHFGDPVVCRAATCLLSLVCAASSAGDWQAAALALGQLSVDAQHQQQLLAVRQERAQGNSSSSSPGGQGDTAPADSSSKGTDVSQTAAGRSSSSRSLRQELQLHAPERYAALARSAAGAVESVR